MTLKRIPLPSWEMVLSVAILAAFLFSAYRIYSAPHPSVIDQCISIIQKGDQDKLRLQRAVEGPSMDDVLKGAK